MSRLTDNDRSFGPVTWGRSSFDALLIEWRSGGDEDNEGRAQNCLMIYLLGWAIRIGLPNILRPFREKVIAGWDAATVERLGRDWYYNSYERIFGFCLHEGHLNIRFGRSTGDSSTDRRWGCFLAWTQWRHVRHSLYDQSGNLWSNVHDRGMRWEARKALEDSCPTVRFAFIDYDGQRIEATTRIEEREWLFGEKWFKWLSWFRKPMIRRSLNLQFSAEVGPEKGSWKGGTTGHGVEMLPGELHEEAFRRYCEQNHRQRGRYFQIKFVERLAA